jgi:hypothetical protein
MMPVNLIDLIPSKRSLLSCIFLNFVSYRFQNKKFAENLQRLADFGLDTLKLF